MSGVLKKAGPKKIAVVLFNLGGPDGKDTVRPFLFNFFMDKNIVRLPQPFRFLLAGLIAVRRSKKEAGSSYDLLGGKSPLLKNTQAQARALENLLNRSDDADYRCFVSMRYWHPLTGEAVRQVIDYAPDHVVLLPLYPQYSTTTTRSSFQQWMRHAENAGLKITTGGVCCYPREDGFIAASAVNVRRVHDEIAAQAQAKKLPPPRILFSAHGLPEKIVADGDPYQWQCEKTADAIVQKAGLDDLDWEICYQSRVGPRKWLGPSTEEAIKRAGADNLPVIIYPHAFVSEHVETLVEIGIEYRQLAEKEGVPLFARVPTVATDEAFIAGLAGLVRKAQEQDGILPANQGQPCPVNFRRCCQRDRTVFA